MVNNAGTNIPENFLNVKKTSLETLLNVNTKAVFNIAQLCANQIIKLKRKQGSIINISSIFGLVAGQKRTVYSMTKFGVEGLTKGMALDLAKYNIRVNSVCPNIVLTPRTKKYFNDKKYNKYVKESTPINKVVTISDVATSITFLASEASSMITGNIYYYRWRLDSKMKNVFLFIIIFFYSNISNAVEFRGKFEQGSFIIGKATKGSKVEVDKRKIRLTKDGYFAFGLDRDRKNNVVIKIHENGKTEVIERKILKRDYKIQKIDGLPKKQVTPPPEVYERIKKDNILIGKARSIDTTYDYFKDKFINPIDKYIITGVYGSQRILNGKPRRPHYGIDFHAPEGTPVKAMMDGEITLAERDMYFTGGTIIFDHGHGISTLYMHMKDVNVKVGQKVKQGDIVGTLGKSGRATGPHLDIRLNWFEVKLDPASVLNLK